jgi:histidine ammonia-lyase
MVVEIAISRLVPRPSPGATDLRGESLSPHDISRVARRRFGVKLNHDPVVLSKIGESRAFVEDAENVTPRVRAHGSIGASGDLVPLSCITGSICGLAPDYRVNDDGEEVDALQALQRLGLPPLRPEPREALAMMNGTSVMTAVAANCTVAARKFLDGSIAQSFRPVLDDLYEFYA